MKVKPSYLKQFLKKEPNFKQTTDNLCVRVGSGKTKKAHFHFRYKCKQQYFRHSLGVLSETASSEDLQQTALEITKQFLNFQNYYLQGVTPADLEAHDRRATIDHQQQYASRLTVDEMFQMYFKEYLNKKVKKPSQKTGLYKNHIKPQIGKMVAEEVTRKSLQSVINLLRDAGKKAQAHNAAVFLATVWKWASKEKEDDLPNLNSTRASGLMTDGAKSRDREAEDEELRYILIYGAPVVRACVFMGQRVIETLHMEYQDFDGEHWLEIPPIKYKTKKHHRVYITDSVLKCIEEHQEYAKQSETLKTSSRYCFVGLNSKAGNHFSHSQLHKYWKQLELEKLALPDKPTLQKRDLRRTLYSYLEQHRSVDVAGAVAGHTKKGMAQIYGRYDYKEEKKEAMIKWEEHLLSLLK